MTKLSGAGNSFLLTDIDRLEGLPPSESKMQDLAVTLCDPHFGVGADGFIFLKKTGDRKYQWNFYNADGSEAEMCGNATRCVGRYLKLKPEDPAITLKTIAGNIEIRCIKDGKYESRMSFDADVKIKGQSLEIEGKSIEGLFLDTGVPHFCIRLSENEFKNLDEVLADKIQKHKSFQPKETNVTFWTQVKNDEIKATSYERGVHEFTLACGTGAAAAALAFIESSPELKSDNSEKKVKVQMPGGRLKLRIQDNKVYLSGPAVKIATIKAKEPIS